MVNRDRAALEGHEFAAALGRIARMVGRSAAAASAAITPPSLVSIKQPPYPALARKFRVEGVVVRLTIDESGKVTSVELVKGVGRGNLDETALAAARTALFRPATRNGPPVASTYELKIPFRL